MDKKLVMANSGFTRSLHIKPKTFNKEERTVEVIWTKGTRVDRGDFAMELDLSDDAVDLSRLKNKAPVLDNHDSGMMCGPSRGLHGKSLGQIGVVEDAWFEGKNQHRKGIALLRFSRRKEVDDIFNDIEDGVIRNISVGFSIQEVEQTDSFERNGEEIPVYTARKWQPMEISPVQAGADDGAMTRSVSSEDDAKTVEELVTEKQEQGMFDGIMNTSDSTPGQRANTTPIDDAVRKVTDELTKVVKAVTEKRELDKTEESSNNNITDENKEIEQHKEISMDEITKKNAEIAMEAKKAERKRANDITEAVEKAGLERSFADELIKSEVSADEARAQILDKLADKTEEKEVRSNIQVGVNNSEDHIKRGLQNSWLNRGNAEKYSLDEHGKKFSGLSLVRSAAAFLESVHNEKTSFMSNGEIVTRALSTSDFPELLADTMNKSLRDSYTEHPQTFEGFVRKIEVQDFKEISRKNFGDAPNLEKVKEHGSTKLGSISEDSEKYAVETFAKKMRITRNTLINDDLDAMIRIPSKFGIAARDLESDLIWNTVIIGPGGFGQLMGDGKTLFHADHNNLGATLAFGETSISELEEFLLEQRGLDKRRIMIQPGTIYGGSKLRTAFRKFVALTSPTNDAETNIFKDLSWATESRIGDNTNGAKGYYLFGASGSIDMVEMAYLAGSGQAPMIETTIFGGTKGIEVEAIHDVGVKAIDFRGFTYNQGA